MASVPVPVQLTRGHFGRDCKEAWEFLARQVDKDPTIDKYTLEDCHDIVKPDWEALRDGFRMEQGMVTLFGEADPVACPSPETFKGWFDEAWDGDDHQISFTRLAIHHSSGRVQNLGGMHRQDHRIIAVMRGHGRTPEFAIHEVLHHVRGDAATEEEVCHDAEQYAQNCFTTEPRRPPGRGGGGGGKNDDPDPGGSSCSTTWEVDGIFTYSTCNLEVTDTSDDCQDPCWWSADGSRKICPDTYEGPVCVPGLAHACTEVSVEYGHWETVCTDGGC